jgi:hypothetical protein
VFDKVPSSFWEPLWVWGMGLIGALVGYLEDFKLADDWKTWALKACTKAASSALAAKLTYHLLISMGQQDENLRLVMVGISAHMGCEALKVIGEAYRSRLGK